MLENKKFQNNDTGEIVNVIDDSGVFFKLSNGSNIKSDIFFKKYSEAIDPTTFFTRQSQEGLASLAEQFKNIDSRHAVDGNVPPVVRDLSSFSYEQTQSHLQQDTREEMIRRFNEKTSQQNASQYKVYENDDEAADDFMRKTQPQVPQRPPRRQQQYQQEQYYEQAGQVPQDTGHAMPDEPGGINPNEPIYQQPQPQTYFNPDEEAFRFFKTFKRTHPIELNVTFDERIADPEFIRLMVFNMEGDIIKFYTKGIMDRIYNDPGYLEMKIYEKLKSIVFNSSSTNKKERKPRVIPNVPKNEREKIQEGVPEKIKKPRKKKTEGE